MARRHPQLQSSSRLSQVLLTGFLAAGLAACSPQAPADRPADAARAPDAGKPAEAPRATEPSKAADAATPAGATASTGATAGAASGQAATGITLIEPGKLTVCTHLSFKPFEFRDATGKVVGFDIDFADLIARRLGVTTQIVDIDFASQTSGAVFAARKCDLSVAGTTMNDKRRQAIRFSVPYFSATQALLVRKDSAFKGLSDLKGRRLGVQTDTTGQEYAKKNLATHGYELVVFDDLPTLVNGLKAGRVDAAVSDNGPLLDFAKDNADTTVVAEFPTGEQYGMAVQKDDPNAAKLLAVVDDVITGSLKDGSYRKIYATWFGAEPAELPSVR